MKIRHVKHTLRYPRTTQELRRREADRVDSRDIDGRILRMPRVRCRPLPTAWSDLQRAKPARKVRRRWRRT